MKVFVKWWLLVVLILTGCFFAYNVGVFREIYEKDATRLSFVIMGLFAYLSLWCGVKSFRLGAHKKVFLENDKNKYTRLAEIGWFTSDLCLTVGMIGTVCGFILMLKGFFTVEISSEDVQSLKTLMKEVGFGMSTALYTTLVGLVCSALLKLQYFNLTQAIEAKEVKGG